MNALRNARGRGRRPRSVRGGMRQHVRRQHELDFRGLVLRGPNLPTRTIITPWNSLVLSTVLVGGTSPSNVCISVADIHAQFVATTGLTTANVTAYRVMQMQAWHLIPNGELNNRVRVRCYSLINETTTCDYVKVLAQIEDYGTPALNATAKFIWPLTHSSNVFAYNSTEVVMRFALESSQQVLIHTRVLWKFISGASSVSIVTDTGLATNSDEATRTSDHSPGEICQIDEWPEYTEGIVSSIENLSI